MDFTSHSIINMLKIITCIIEKNMMLNDYDVNFTLTFFLLLIAC